MKRRRIRTFAKIINFSLSNSPDAVISLVQFGQSPEVEKKKSRAIKIIVSNRRRRDYFTSHYPKMKEDLKLEKTRASISMQCFFKRLGVFICGRQMIRRLISFYFQLREKTFLNWESHQSRNLLILELCYQTNELF